MTNLEKITEVFGENGIDKRIVKITIFDVIEAMEKCGFPVPDLDAEYKGE